MAEEIVLGDLKIKLRLDDAGLDVAVKKANSKMDDLSKKAATVGKAVGAGIAAVVAAVSGAVAVALNRADDLSKAAAKIGVGVTELSRLEYAGRLADVSLESLTTSLRFLNRNLVEAGEGSKTAQSAFDQLGITIKNADGSLRAADEILGDVADRFARLEEGPRKTALAMEVFGRSGADMIPMLNEGREGLKELGDEAERLGLVLDTETAANAERVNDAFTRLWGGIQGLATRVAVALMPQLTKLADFFESKDFQQAVQDTARVIAESIGVLIQIFVGVTKAATDFFNLFNARLSESARRVGQVNQLTIQELEQDEKEYADMLTGEKWLWDRPATERRLAAIREELERRRQLGNELPFKPPVTGLDIPTGPEAPAPEEEQFILPPILGGGSGEEQQARLDAIRDSLKSEAELLTDSFVEQQRQLEEFLDLGLITKQDYDLLTQRAEKQHWEAMKEIRQEGLSDLEKFTAMSWDQQAKTIFGEMESITAGVKNQNAILFNINKAAAVANAVVNTYQGISKSLSAYPMPLAGIMAGIHAAAGFAQVSSLMATTPNTTSGSARGLGGSGGAADGAATQAAVAPQSNVQYVKGIRPGDLFTGDTLRSLAEGLLDYQKNGGQVVFVE